MHFDFFPAYCILLELLFVLLPVYRFFITPLWEKHFVSRVIKKIGVVCNEKVQSDPFFSSLFFTCGPCL